MSKNLSLPDLSMPWRIAVTSSKLAWTLGALVAAVFALAIAIQRVENRQLELQRLLVRHVQQKKPVQDRAKSRRLRTYRSLAADIGLADNERQLVQRRIVQRVFLQDRVESHFA